MIACRQPAIGISRESNRGFALVITLTLMILLTVIAVGLLTLASITLRVSNQGKDLIIAREQARIALVLAIGELQQYAGQDQRFTATADIAGTADGRFLAVGAAPLNDSSVNGKSKGLSAVQPGTRYWTGVFTNRNTPDSIYTQTPSPNIVHWLVSGSTATHPVGAPHILPSDATYAVGPNGAVANADKAVVLVGRNSVGSATDSIERYVTAPLVEVLGRDSAKPVARFAWWVGDEGVKARINMDKTFEDKTHYAALTAQRRGWETVDGFSSYPTPSAGVQTSIPKIITTGETALLVPNARATGDGASPLQNVFHSATTDSRAVLSDTLRGGTRIDLSAILAGALPSSSAVSTIPNYPVRASNIIPASAAPTIKAPMWDALKDFADRARSLEGGSLIVTPAATDLTAAMAPLITDFRILFGAKITKEAAATSFKINPCAKIAIAIANPYSVPLKWKNDLEIELLADTPPNNLLTCIWNLQAVAAYLPRNATAPAVFNKAVFRIAPATLAPGEARAYTLGSHVYRPVSSAASPLSMDMVIADPYGSLDDFHMCVEMENQTDYTSIPFLDVREEWQTSCATVQMRLAGSSNILRRVERLELDQCQWPPVGRSFSNEEATQMTEPFPLLCHSFQISQPGEEYINYMPAAFDMGQRSSTLRTFADFNLQATRFRKPITSYNPPPYFTEWTNSASLLPPVQPLQSADHGGDTGTTFTRNLSTTIRWGRSPLVGSDRTILFSIPARIASIAQLQHADLTGDDRFASIGCQPGNAVGNSYATPFVKRMSISQTRTDYQIIGAPNSTGANLTSTHYYDISYLLNASLWDSYFFSTIPRGGGSVPENPSLIRIGASTSAGDLKDPVKAATSLMLDGAFNCNSTGQTAWKAFLASARCFKHAADTSPNNAAAFPRTLEQTSTSADPPTGNDADSFTGFRRLTDKQLDDLATELVKQVRLRGPFVSLSHFVNRALAGITAQPVLTRGGALQIAIDESGANINFDGTKNAFSEIEVTSTDPKVSTDRVTLLEKQGAPRADYDGTPGNNIFSEGSIPNVDPSVPDWAVTSAAMNYGAVASILADREMFRDHKYKPEQGYRSTGIPGWLTQADVLQVIGPSLTTRSDTFRIRTCGEALDAKGVSVAKVYCEAVVQRVPAYLDPANAPSDRGAELSTLNQTYGRQFQIISFRWLSPNEI